MAHKALLLGLINQGKCLAVTHRVVLSRGSSLIAVLSFMVGSFSVLPRVVRSQSCQRCPYLVASVWCWTFRDFSEELEILWFCCRLGIMIMAMKMILPPNQRHMCDIPWADTHSTTWNVKKNHISNCFIRTMHFWHTHSWFLIPYALTLQAENVADVHTVCIRLSQRWWKLWMQ